MSVDWYDRQGNQISMEQWTKLLEADPEYKRVAETTVNGHWVFTILLGLDHSHWGGPPLIFETMVFPADGDDVASWSEEFCERYSTEEDARAGHEVAVQWAREHEAATP